MGRAERRRAQKAENAPTKVFTLTDDSIKTMIEDAYNKGYKAGVDAKIGEASDNIMMMLLGMPIKVLKDQYHWGNKRIPEFAQHLIDYFTDFQNSTTTISEYQEIVYNTTGIKFWMKSTEEEKE